MIAGIAQSPVELETGFCHRRPDSLAWIIARFVPQTFERK